MRSVRTAVLALLTVLVCSLGSAATAAPATPQRAMWVWDRPQVKTLVAFATKNGVQDLFVSVPADLPASGQLTWFRTLRTQTTAAGIRVHALGSETSWIADAPAALRWQSAARGTRSSGQRQAGRPGPTRRGPARRSSWRTRPAS